MPRTAAEDRLRRILAVVPWVVAEDGPQLSEVCARFDYRDESELQADLDLLFVCGVPPYTPDALIEVDVAEGRVWIRYADWFDRPLRMTPAEALSLVAASSALVGTGVAPDDGPLARGLAKLARALGVSDDLVDVALAPVPADHLSLLQDAAASGHQVEIDYYAYGRDRWSTRIIDPHLVYSATGQWYVSAFCHSVDGDRLFRVDRIRRAAVLPTTFDPRPGQEAPPVFEPSPTDPSVVLELGPEGGWAATQYPTVSSAALGGGRTRVELAVSGDAWLARLLLRLGPDARVVAGDPTPAREAAARILARYGGGPARSAEPRPVASPPR